MLAGVWSRVNAANAGPVAGARRQLVAGRDDGKIKRIRVTFDQRPILS